MLAREPASFWLENVVAVVILLRVLARMMLHRDDSQRRFLARRFLVFEQDCNHSKQCRNNVATRCYCGKNSRCESSRVTSPSVAGTSYQMLEVLAFWKR